MRLKMNILPVPLLKDNYAYILRCSTTQTTAIVDAPHGDLSPLYASLSTTPSHVLTTHKHLDHCGGNLELSRRYPGIEIVGGATEEIPAVTKKVNHGEEFALGALSIRVLHTPCHTTGHVCYYVSSRREGPGSVFTGDTLFTAGIGAFFEGTASDMVGSLKTLLRLPLSTQVYCGHEYTESFLERARNVESDNMDALQMAAEVRKKREDGHPTVGTTLAEELKYNVFLRCLYPELQKSFGIYDEICLLEKVYSMTRRK